MSIAALVMVVSLIAVLDPDPVSSKAADDGDPFGKPQSRYVSLLSLGVGAGFMTAGFWLFRQKR
jgi:hypothetical protein